MPLKYVHVKGTVNCSTPSTQAQPLAPSTRKPLYPMFIFCLATPDQCPQAATCLRHTAWSQQKDTPDVSERLTIDILNPANPALDYATERCRAYISNAPITYARGMAGFFNNVPHERYKTLRTDLQACFSCRSFFFRSQNGQRRITPEEQERIAAVFASHNLPHPPYQSLEQDYIWHAPINI